MVGAGATVMDGATISSGAMVAPGAIVSPNTTVPTGQVGDARLPGRDGGVCRSAPADAGGLFLCCVRVVWVVLAVFSPGCSRRGS